MNLNGDTSLQPTELSINMPGGPPTTGPKVGGVVLIVDDKEGVSGGGGKDGRNTGGEVSSGIIGKSAV